MSRSTSAIALSGSPHDLFTAPLKIGEGNANFLSDLAERVSDEDMRKRWQQGRYGQVPGEFVKGWRRLAGRS